MPRAFFHRLAFAGIGMALLCAAGYIALGWAVWSEQEWLRRVVGLERFVLLNGSYTRVAHRLLPDDRDGDGVSDGLEYFGKSDPRDPRNHPSLELYGGSLQLSVFDCHAPSSDEPLPSSIRLLPRIGERFRVEGGVLPDRSKFWWFIFARGFRLRITAPAGARLASPGGALAEGPLIVPVSGDGELRFDLELPASSTNEWSRELGLAIDNPVTGEILGDLRFYGIRAWAAVTPTTTAMTSEELRSEPNLILVGNRPALRLSWPQLPSPAQAWLLEATSRGEGAEWSFVHIYPGMTTSTIIQQFVSSEADASRGRPQFRVVPIQLNAP